MFDEIRKELLRLKASEVQLQSDGRLGCAAHSTVKVTIGDRSCSLVAASLLEMLKSLPDGATEASIEAALEMRAGRAEAWMPG
jgi:hypothetical protein